MKQKRFLLWIALIAVAAMCFTACSEKSDAPEKSSEELVSLAEILAPQRSTLMGSGETLQLYIPKDREVTVTSSNEAVATVDENGLVTAVENGMAIITVSDGSESALCGVVVRGEGSFIDITKLTARELFTDLELHSATEITGMAVDSQNQTVYLSQSYGTSSFVPLNSEILINEVECKEGTWELASWMRFSGSGKGSICMDNDGTTPRFWMECNGDYIGYGKGISLMEWSDETYCLDSYGQTFTPQGIRGGMTVTADVANNMVLIYDRTEKCYRIYDRAEMLAGQQEPDYVYSFTCSANQTPQAGEDDSQGRYNASVRGYALCDGYLYQFSGSSSIYLSVFDLEGKLQYCHRLTDLPDVEYYMPAAICVTEGKIYVAIASGNSEYNLANVLVFE